MSPLLGHLYLCFARRERLIVRLLADGPLDARLIVRQSEGALKRRTVFPLLRRLERLGFVSSQILMPEMRGHPLRRIYCLAGEATPPAQRRSHLSLVERRPLSLVEKRSFARAA